MLPETLYARCSADGIACHIAYQTLGSGERDVVFMSAWFSHVDGRWEEPRFAAMLRRLASMGRLIVFDRRGSGASDPLPSAAPTWEDWADDILSVMDAAGSKRATLIGVDQHRRAPGPWRRLPWGLSREEVDRFLQRTRETWGTGGVVDVFSPSANGDERYRQWWAKYQRMSASPGRSTAMAGLIFEIDVRPVLSAVHVPTLVMHRRDFRFFPIEHGRYLAEHIAGAKFIELPGADGFIYLGDTGALLDSVEEFVTGARPARDADRVLATVLLTDMVGSTDRAVELGDRRWRAVLDAHDALVRAQLEQYRGKLHRTTGDGVLATFDGPARGIRCAFGIRDELRSQGIDIRAGLHTGEIELRESEIGGIAVHIAARVSALASTGEVLCTSTVKDLVTGSEIAFDDRGAHALKGVPREWQLYAVTQ